MQPVDPDSKARVQGLLCAGPWLRDLTGSWSLSSRVAHSLGGRGKQDTETFSAHRLAVAVAYWALGESTKMNDTGLKDFCKLTGRYVMVPLFI